MKFYYIIWHITLWSVVLYLETMSIVYSWINNFINGIKALGFQDMWKITFLCIFIIDMYR